MEALLIAVYFALLTLLLALAVVAHLFPQERSP